MISAITTNTTKIPVYAPALKIPVIRSQLDNRLTAKKAIKKDKFFIGIKTKKVM